MATFSIADLLAAFKDRPDVTDALKQAPSDTFSSDNSAPITADPSVANLNIPDVNSAKSNFNVPVSDNTVTMNGNQQAMAAPATPPQQPPILLPPTPTAAVAPTPPPPPAVSPTAPTPRSSDIANAMSGDTPLAKNESDNDKRNKMLADEKARHTAELAPVALAGIGDAIANTSASFGGHPGEEAQGKVIALEQQGSENRTKAFDDKMKNDPQSDISKSYREMVLKIAPDLAGNENFGNMSANAIGDKLPLIDTMMKAKASEDAKKLSLAQTSAMRDMNIGLRQDQQQDKLEQNAKQMVSNLRGDKSLARAEEQRDAAIVAYNRLNEIQKSGKEPNPVDYTDILGQIYKARTGTAPGEQVLNDIRQSTAKGSLDKAYTYVTGNQAPATTQDITNSLKNMAQSMGTQADKFHEGYMKAHLIKPSGLDDDRWQPIVTTGRGVSFKDATGSTNDAAPSQKDPLGIL